MMDANFGQDDNRLKIGFGLTLNINRALSTVSPLSDSVLLQLSKTTICVLFCFYLFGFNSFFRCFIFIFPCYVV